MFTSNAEKCGYNTSNGMARGEIMMGIFLIVCLCRTGTLHVQGYLKTHTIASYKIILP